MTLTFGKYRGQTMDQVVGKDRRYVEWMAQTFDNATIRDAAKQALGWPTITATQGVVFGNESQGYARPANCRCGGLGLCASCNAVLLG